MSLQQRILDNLWGYTDFIGTFFQAGLGASFLATWAVLNTSIVFWCFAGLSKLSYHLIFKPVATTHRFLTEGVNASKKENEIKNE